MTQGIVRDGMEPLGDLHERQMRPYMCVVDGKHTYRRSLDSLNALHHGPCGMYCRHVYSLPLHTSAFAYDKRVRDSVRT